MFQKKAVPLRRFMRRFIVFLSFILSLSLNMMAYDVLFDGFYYNLSGDSAIVTNSSAMNLDNNSYKGAITIPETITYEGQTYRVTTIGASAFAYCTSLYSVTAEHITSIEMFAYSECTSLTHISLSPQLHTIGAFAFNNCTALSGITLPAALLNIEHDAFMGCNALTQINIPANVRTIGIGAFAGTESMVAIEVDTNNENYYSANNCIVERASQTLIAGCRTSTIPNTVTTIGAQAFTGCRGLNQMIIPANVTRIEDYAFALCTGMKQLIINNSVTHLGSCALLGCSGLTSLLIPHTMQTIGESALAYCNQLKSIHFPKNLNSIGQSALAWCTGLQTIIVEEGNPNYCALDNCLIELASETMLAGCGNSVIPSNVRHIATEALAGHSNFATIRLPDSLQSIGNYAFTACKALKNIRIPDKVTSIGERAFADCSTLENIYFRSHTPAIIAPTIVDGTNTRITVPCEALNVYAAAEIWKEMTNLNTAPVYQITLESANIYFGSVAVISEAPCDEPIATVEATAKKGYVFTHWNDGNEDNPRDIELVSDTTLVANFAIESNIPISHITLSPTTLQLYVGNARQLTATITPSNATNKNIYWSSSDANIVEVLNNWVIGMNAGEATVTASSADGKCQASCLVTVKSDTTTNNINNNTNTSLDGWHKVIRNGRLLIVRDNPQTGQEEIYSIDGRKLL